MTGTVGVTDVSSEVQAAVAWYPPTHFRTIDEQAPADAFVQHDAANSPESLLVCGPLRTHSAAADFASPLSHVGPAAAPLLLIHRLEDRVVPYRQTVMSAEALEATGASVELHLVPGADHVFDGVDMAPIVEQSTRFLVDRLGYRCPRAPR